MLTCLLLCATHTTATFGYDDSSTSLPGPSSWATLPGSAVCSTGRFQSPLNILSSFAAYYANYGNLAFSYSPDTTIQITETGSGVSLTSTGFSNNLLSVSNVLNGSYVLSSVNFHWAQDNAHVRTRSLSLTREERDRALSRVVFIHPLIHEHRHHLDDELVDELTHSLSHSHSRRTTGIGAPDRL